MRQFLLSRHCILRFLQGKFTIVIGDCYIFSIFAAEIEFMEMPWLLRASTPMGSMDSIFIDDTTNILATLVEQERTHLW